jgi:hypothetical protein
MNELLMQALNVTLSVLIPILIVYVFLPWLQAKVGKDSFDKAREIALEAANAIEQAGSEMTSEQKKAAAVEYAKKLLAWRKITVDDNILNGLIEGAVFLVKLMKKGDGSAT